MSLEGIKDTCTVHDLGRSVEAVGSIDKLCVEFNGSCEGTVVVGER